jgi:hypothetical protein
MLLIHPDSNEVVVKIEKNDVKIINNFLFKGLKVNGISIPGALRDSFEGKKVIYIEDPLFAKAFIEVYYPNCLKEAGFKLIDL